MKRHLKTSVLAILSVAVILASPFPSNSAVWTNLDLYGGQVYDIAIDQVNPDKMFAGIYMGDGLYLSEDGGNTWQGVETDGQLPGEDEFKNDAVRAVKIAPSDNNVIWVAHSYWVEKSMDGGQTWTHIFNRDMQRDCTGCGGEGDNFRSCRSLAIDPFDHQTVYVGTGGPDGTYSSGAIYKTNDGGKTWTKMDQGNDFDFMVMDIDIDPQNSSTIWAVTSSTHYGGVGGGTLYRSANGGDTWEEIFSLTPDGWAYLTVAVKPNDSNTVFTGSGIGIIKHYYHDNEWKFIWPVIEDSRRVEDLSFDPQNPEILYAVWLHELGEAKVSRSTNGGEDWETYTVEYHFFTIAIHPTDSEVIFGGDYNIGVCKSHNHGQTWVPVNNGINAVNVYDVAIDPKDSSHILAATLSGLYEKKNGQEWASLLPEGFSRIAGSVEFHPTDSLTFYAGLDAYVAKTTDGGITWTYSNYLGCRIVNDIAIDPIDTDTIYIALNAGIYWGSIYKSVDGGGWFTEVLVAENQHGETFAFNTIAIDPSDNQHVFAGGGDFYAPGVLGNLYESTDGGINWTLTGLQNEIVNALLIHPENPDIMYAGCGSSGGTLVPLYKSTDGGITWTESFKGIPDEPILFVGLWGSSGTDVFAVGSDGTVLHYDGNNWSAMTSGTIQHLYGVWGSSGTDVFTVGSNGVILYYNGINWSAMTSGTIEHLNGVWGSSETDVFAVGLNGTVLHYNGINWSAMTSGTTEDLKGVWGSSETDVFAVGLNGTVLHYDGINWSSMTSGTTEDLNGVWGGSETDVFAVGLNGTLLRYNGIDWSAMTSGTTRTLLGVWGSSGTDIFAVGNMGTILHYDGITWSDMGQDSKEQYSGVWSSSGSDVFVSGYSGSILHYNGSAWSFMRPEGSWHNAVVDMEFHNVDNNVLYAASFGAGVYLSPNQAGKWLNLGTPEHRVFAISAGSLYAATQDGVYQCTGTGVIAGDITDAGDQSAIDGATVFNDLGATTISVNGEYMMVSPAAASCMVTAIKNGYTNKSVDNVTIYGGDITWLNFAMEAGDPTPQPDGDGNGGGACFIKTAAIDFTGDEKRLWTVMDR